MIIPVLFAFAALFVLTSGLLNGALAHARSAGGETVEHVADQALSIAESGLLAQLQSIVAGNVAASQPAGSGIDQGLTSSTPLTPANAATLYYTTQAHVNGTTSAGGSGETALNLQASSLAQEERLSATVSVEVHGALPDLSGPASNALAVRSRSITVRIFAVPPYAIVDAERDVGTTDGTTDAEGDPAGVMAQAGDVATPDPAQPDLYHDTTIKVRYGCAGPDVAGVDPGNDGTPWGNAPGGLDEACNPTPPPWSASPAPATLGDGDLFATPAPWANSNVNQSGWAQ